MNSEAKLPITPKIPLNPTLQFGTQIQLLRPNTMLILLLKTITSTPLL